jgi:hypothetical protein
MSVEKTKKQMAGFKFPTAEQQMTEFFGEKGMFAELLPFMGKMFATEAAPAKEDYSTTIDTSFLK